MLVCSDSKVAIDGSAVHDANRERTRPGRDPATDALVSIVGIACNQITVLIINIHIEVIVAIMTSASSFAQNLA